jgi:8-oxo-dGTP pyrophosphatase MutT (NUDIX family)
MDITIPLENFILNIRVAVLIKKDGGFILEKGKGGYYFPVGGRMKTGETSIEAAQREILEELGVAITNLKLKAIVEQFFGDKDKRVQEICFVYTGDTARDVTLTDAFATFTAEVIDTIDFRPELIKEVLKSRDEKILHFATTDKD